MRRNYFYRFADGYFCYYSYKLKGDERKVEIINHGVIVTEKVC